MRQRTAADNQGRAWRAIINSLLVLILAAVISDLHMPAFSSARSNPTRIRIPSIGVNSTVMNLGLLKDGSLQVPPTGFPAGWYTGSATPGELGPSIIAGHIDWNGPGVFYRLDRINLGDQILVDRANGTRAIFTVIRVASFLKSHFPTHAV